MAEELNLKHFDLGTFVDYVHALKQEHDALRAQLPSQGVEAVAWRVTGRGGITITGQYPEWAEADCLLTITPLYTSPADTPADSRVVPVELLELICKSEVEIRDNPMAMFNAVERLRALLEQSQ